MNTNTIPTSLRDALRPMSAFASLTAAALCLTALPSHAAMIVDLQASTAWVTIQQNSARTGTNTTGDYGSGSPIDRRNVIPFDTSTPMFTPAQLPVQSGTFYGGKNNTYFDNTNNPGYDNRLVDGGSTLLPGGDRYIFGTSMSPGAGKRQYAALVSLWKKADFLNGGDANQVNITANNAFQMQIGAQAPLTARWLVQIGSTYYVSQESYTTSANFTASIITSTSATTTLWAPIDLTANGGDLTATPGTYAALTLNNIDGVGVYASLDAVNNGGARWTLEAFSVNATVIPEPSAMALLAVSLTALVVFRRRRRLA